MGTSGTRRHGPGQAIVEFAIIVALMLPLLLAITVDFGRVFSAWIDMGNMARAGAQYGSVGPFLGVEDPATLLTKMDAAALAEQPTIFGTAPSTYAALTQDATSSNWNAESCVVYTFRPILQFWPIPSAVTLHRQITMRMQFVPPAMSATQDAGWASPCQ